MKKYLGQILLGLSSLAVLVVAGNTEPSAKVFRLLYHSDTQGYYRPCG